jgi:phytoene/squalene synthetase
MAHPAFPQAWREFAGLARAEFANAEQALQRCDRRAMRPARIMMEVYRRNLTRMMALSDSAIADPALAKRLVGKTEMLAIALRYGLF